MIAMFACLSLCFNLYAFPFSKIVFFGDSLTDTGNACPQGVATNNVWCVLYGEERFTDGGGLVWSELFAKRFGFILKPSRLGGDNFAFGGATSGTGTFQIPGVISQVENYLHKVNQADSEALYVIWVGGNDIKNNGIPSELIDNVRNSIQRLADQGAKHFIVPNLPPIHDTPIADHIISGLSYLTTHLWNWYIEGNAQDNQVNIKSILGPVLDSGVSFYNRLLNEALCLMEQNLVIQIYKPDMFELFKRVSKDPNKYGLKQPQDLFSIDLFHPSARAHQIIANEIANLF